MNIQKKKKRKGTAGARASLRFAATLKLRIHYGRSRIITECTCSIQLFLALLADISINMPN